MSTKDLDIDGTLMEVTDYLSDAIVQLRNLIAELDGTEYKMLRDKLEKKTWKLEKINSFIRDINGD